MYYKVSSSMVYSRTFDFQELKKFLPTPFATFIGRLNKTKNMFRYV